ncbi:Rieske (2Fe-2S) protein [Streptomyces sp. TRM70350]|uniref:Rieske (2Fe-2S) protein n=1 Tax=Streptomyces sp. TRM70350 TaxID=2856165 RepID=UPI001C44B8B6|nr:Rieske (2Fe-2S) protein [Streptomyces sp. TRM70350]MBV7700473.1 Rieske (2Fe-2S) protein [Streptomyces sp. TRM70350]
MSSETLHTESGPARRTVMAAAGAAGLAVALTACGSGDDSSESGSESGAGSGAGAGAGTVLAKTSDVPEGGGKVFGDVVVTQPTAGDYKAFSAKCTHQGCAVANVTDGVIVCPCHDSRFSATDGSVQKGPATQPLAAEQITVEGDEIRLV